MTDDARTGATILDDGSEAVRLRPSLPEIGEDPLLPPYASWVRRVVAYLLDTAVLSGVMFFAIGPVGVLSLLPGITFGSGPDVALTDSGWVATAALGFALLQAYTGATPGKRVTGIVVLRTSTRRPAGLVVTVLRWLAHLLDCILLIGYLRPLWHAQRRTFADSLAGTVVVHRPAPDAAWPVTRRRASALVTAGGMVLCGTGVAFAVGPTTWSGSGGWVSGCTRTAADLSAPAPLVVDTTEVAYTPGTTTATRWGVSRTYPTPDLGMSSEDAFGPGRPGLTAAFAIDGATTPAPGGAVDADLVLTVDDADGHRVTQRTGSYRVSFDGGAATWEERATAVSAPEPGSVHVEESMLVGLEPGWTWHTSVRVDGSEIATCAGSEAEGGTWS
ncbi:RDD family protein [Cellulosimicrobium terreum]|nr:RDD family protein [Cellulosimicrobium terreum]